MNSAARHEKRNLADSIYGSSLRARSWSIESAYQYCETLARSHYENFPIGSLLLPARLRKHLYCIYAFARTADDFADEGYSEGCLETERLDLLSAWREMLLECFQGRAAHPIFVALSQTRQEFDFPIEPFEDLLSAFVQDVTTRRYQDYVTLLDYCRRSANPIGRLVLLLFGYRDPRLQEWSDNICTALQLTNHWQDVELDLRKDRVYLPLEDLMRFNLSANQLELRQCSEAFKELMEFEVARTRALFIAGKPLCVHVRGRLGLELRAIWLGGWRILERIEKNRYDVFARRPVLTLADKVRVFARAIGTDGFRRS